MSSDITLIQPTANPFTIADGDIRACWELGFHDGVKGLNPSVGEAALPALIATRVASLAQREADLAVSEIHEKRLSDDLIAAKGGLIPELHEHPVGFWPWCTAAIYVLIGVIAFCAEFPLAALTVGESLGSTQAGSVTVGLMQWFRESTVLSLAAILCLVTFSIKILLDSIHLGRRRNWLEIGIGLITICICATAIFGIAHLRDAIGQQQIAMQRQMALQRLFSNGASNVAVASGELNDAKGATEQAQTYKAHWTGFTYRWVTYALPCFAALCLVVGFRQFREYRIHNKAVSQINRVSPELADEMQSQTRLQSALSLERETIVSPEETSDPSSESLKQIQAAYQHGMATGSAERKQQMLQLPLYERLLNQLNGEGL